MDCDSSVKNPLLYLDPLCSDLNMLADVVASGLLDQDNASSIPSLKIKLNVKSIKTGKEGNNYDGSVEPSLSNKPNKLMAASFAAYSSCKFHPGTEEGATSKADNGDEDVRITDKKRRAMKGKSVAVINEAEDNDALHQDPVAVEPSPPKSVDSDSRRRPRHNIVVEAAPSELPQEFKDKINELGGNETALLITKILFHSDLNEQQNRLSIPSKHMENVNFLRESEIEDLEGGNGIDVKLIQPSLEVTTLTLAKWNMRKKKGRISSSYVLRSPSWKKVIKDNDLKIWDRVQVWSFRIQEELCMAMVKV